MLKQPLFGQDSSPHRTSFFVSLLSTFIFWILFTVMAIFVKIENPSPQYKTVQIVLDSPVPVEQIEQSDSEFTTDTETTVVESEAVVEESVVEPSPVVEEAAQVVETVEPAVEKPKPAVEKPAPAKKEPVVEKKQETVTETPKKVETKPVETKPVETPQTVTDESKKVDYALQKSVEEMMEEQMANKKTKQNVDWDAMFGDDSSSTEKTTTTDTKKVTTQSTTTGSAANTATTENKKQTSNSTTEKSSQTTASKSTSSDLDKIANAVSQEGSKTKTDITARTSKDGTGKVVMEMSDGTKRALLIPKEPVINLSENAAQLITVPKATVRITFRVVEKGNIPRTEIKITPESILPPLVRSEIIDQLSQWVFESADTDATATFEYTIEKR